MKSIDMKSLIIGLLLGLCAVLAAGAVGGTKYEVGRYRIATGQNYYCMVIDSKTGQLWHIQGASGSSDWGSPEEWKK